MFIIGGEADPFVGVQASYWYEIADCRQRTACLYTGLGHAAYEEAKDFNQRVFGFLETE